jgi:thermitase
MFRGKSRAAVAAILGCFTLLSAAAPATHGAAPHIHRAAASTQRSAESIVVRTLSPRDARAVAGFARSRGYAVRERVRSLHVLEISVPPGAEAQAVVAELAAHPQALYAEPVYAVAAADVPSDQLYTRQSDYLEPIHAPEAWDIETGRGEVIVAVLDTGIDASHPDLAGRIWTNTGEADGNGLDDDGNGCVDDLHGCSFVGGGGGCVSTFEAGVDDDVGHGTFIAGIVAANADGAGIVGVARGVTVLPVKVLDCTGVGDTLALTQGILYAAERGADVINVSLGGPDESALVREAVRIATEDHGALIVAATGNTGSSGVFYPARYPEVLAVGAASAENPDAPAPFTTSGSEVDVVAVGEGIVGTVPAAGCGGLFECIDNGPYAEASGTSFASPQAAGLAALMLSRRPGLTAAALQQTIKATATPLPPGDRPDWAGAGRIDMARALTPQFRIFTPGVTKN